MAENTRILFTFDQRSYENLESLGATFGFSSKAETVRAALRLANTLRDQVEKGYSEIVVRNPNTGAERILAVDFLDRLAKTTLAR